MVRPIKPRKVGGPHELMLEAMNEIGEREGDPAHGLEIAAAFEGKSHWTLRKELDPDQKGEMSFVSMARLAAKYRLETVAQYFATLAGGVFLSLKPLGINPKWGELTGKTAVDMGRFTSEMVRDLSDGKMDRVEAGRCLKIHSELMRHHAQLHSMLRAVANGEDLE